MANKKSIIFCEIAPPGNQYSPGVYAFRDHANYTIAQFWDLSKYVWIEDPIRGVRWAKNPDRSIMSGLCGLTDEEDKHFFFVKLRAKYM